MAALESALTVLASYHRSNRCCFYAKPPDSIKLQFGSSHFPLSHNTILSRTLSSNNNLVSRPCFELCFALQEAEIEEKPEQTEVTNSSKKLCVLNLPWSLSAVDIKDLFGQCGTVKRVDVRNSALSPSILLDFVLFYFPCLIGGMGFHYSR